MKIKIIINRIIIVAIVMFICIYILMMIAGHKAESYVKSSNISITNIAPGKYRGAYMIFGIKTGADIEFEGGGEIVSNIIVHDLFGTLGFGAIGKVREMAVAATNLDFDAVSGASKSSAFVRAAMYMAIENGSRKQDN